MMLLSSNLKAFIAVTEHSTLASAATRLKITQSAMTLRIQSLESELGIDLFVRSRRGMILTPSGESLLRYCKRAIELESEIMPNMKEIGSVITPIKWIIQSPSSPMGTRILHHVSSYRVKFPNVTLELRVSDLDSGIESLKKGLTDLLVTERRFVTKEFDSKVLKPERYILVGPAQWKRRSVKELISNEKIIDFDPTDTMTQRFLEKYKLFSMAKSERFFVNTTDYIAQLVCKGVGYSVLSEEMSASLIKSKELVNLMPDCFFDLPIALAWYPRKQMSENLRGLIKLIN